MLQRQLLAGLEARRRQTVARRRRLLLMLVVVVFFLLTLRYGVPRSLTDSGSPAVGQVFDWEVEEPRRVT